MSQREPLTDYEERIVDNVREHGWYCVAVFGETEGSEFAYSVGFWETLRVPELIILGLPVKLMHSMLWSAFRQIKAQKILVADGVRWPDLIEGFDCISRPVHPTQVSREKFNSALWYRRYRTGLDEDLEAFQLFWPGAKDGLFPWEVGCSDLVREYQQQLYLPYETGIA
jgi:hypothetical protein